MKEVQTQSFWTFQFGTQVGINVPILIIVGFQQQDRRDSQNLNGDILYRPPVTSTQCIMGTESYLDNSRILNYDDDDYFQGYGQTKEAFRALTKDDIFNHTYLMMISDHLMVKMILDINFTFST